MTHTQRGRERDVRLIEKEKKESVDDYSDAWIIYLRHRRHKNHNKHTMMTTTLPSGTSTTQKEDLFRPYECEWHCSFIHLIRNGYIAILLLFCTYS